MKIHAVVERALASSMLRVFAGADNNGMGTACPLPIQIIHPLHPAHWSPMRPCKSSPPTQDRPWTPQALGKLKVKVKDSESHQ